VQKREAVEYLLAAYRIGVRRGCRLMMQSRRFTTTAAAAMTGPSRSGYGRLQKPALICVNFYEFNPEPCHNTGREAPKQAVLNAT